MLGVTLYYIGTRFIELYPEAMSARPFVIKNTYQPPTPLPTVTPTPTPKSKIYEPGPTPNPWKFAKEWKGRGNQRIDWFTAKCEYWKLSWQGDIEIILEQAGKSGQIDVHQCKDKSYIHRGLGRFCLTVKSEDFWHIEMHEAKFPHALNNIQVDGVSPTASNY
jgi:hypothetical protein